MIRLLALIVISCLIVGICLAIDFESRQEVRHVQPIRSSRVYGPGEVVSETETIELRPKILGQVVDILVDECYNVETGEPLLQLSDKAYRQKVKLAEAELEVAGKTLEAKKHEFDFATTEWSRISKLANRNVLTEAAIDKARTTYARLKVEIELAEASILATQTRLELAKTNLEKTILTSPVDGVILDVDVEVGEMVGPEHSPAIIMTRNGGKFVRVFIDELDALRVQSGMIAEVTTDSLPSKRFRGTVTKLSPTMSSKRMWTNEPGERQDTRTREVWVRLDDEARELIFGFRVDVLIEMK